MRADPNRCLLLIDDEPAQRRLVTAIGARAGWWVRGAPDFDAARKMFEDPQEPKFDAILLDHWLPGEAGTAQVVVPEGAEPVPGDQGWLVPKPDRALLYRDGELLEANQPAAVGAAQ